MIFGKSGATRFRFLENSQQLNQVFSEILSNAIVDFGKSAALGPGIFREKTHYSISPRRKTMMFIRGPGISGKVVMPIFSETCRHQQCAFKKIRSNKIRNFLKSSTAGSRFFKNPPQPNQGFKKILSRSCDPAAAIPGYSSSAA